MTSSSAVGCTIKFASLSDTSCWPLNCVRGSTSSIGTADAAADMRIGLATATVSAAAVSPVFCANAVENENSSD